MSKVRIDISVSLDGFVAGPDQSLDDPLGKGGEGLHEWVTAASSWRERHGQEGGEDNADSRVTAEKIEGTGAEIMGRKMFSGGSGPWESDPNAAAWWGDDPPFHHPVFVVTHHEREPESFPNGTTYNFVTDGIESALGRAREAAGDKDVLIAGGAQIAGQYLAAGLVDELELHVAPVLLGSGERLLDNVGTDVRLELDRVVDSPTVTHLRYRVG